MHPSQSVPPLQQQETSLHSEETVEADARPSWNDATHRASPRRRSHLRRFRFLYLAIFAVLLLIFLPPLVNLGRYQRTIATSIGNSVGRPVHLDRVSLTLLPLPGFTIENLVVGEDPAFGSEPIIRANQVHVTLRISSLWRRHVEFSTISFTDPSVNLVHAADGRWNIEGILLQASRIETAPTAQRRAGPAPRFPYIEATGARLNFKQDQEKLPFSLVDADFALWLPDPHQWHLRLRAHPTRTDSNVSDTGTIELESTLGAASSLSQVPLNLQGQWRDAPLGEASRVLLGRDAGWRGEMNLTANIRGTFGESAITTRLSLADARPADFVPEKLLNTQAECFATATGIFHGFQDVRCSWPPAAAHTPALVLTGSIPNIHQLGASSLQLKSTGIPSSVLLSGLRIISPQVGAGITSTGVLTGSLTYGSPTDAQPEPSPSHWQGQLTLTGATLKAPLPQKKDNSALSPLTVLEEAASALPEVGTDGSVAILLTQDVHLNANSHPTVSHRHGAVQSSDTPHGFALAPTSLMLGGHDPAVLEGHFDPTGYTLHLSGNVTVPRLQLLASSLPPLGDGLMKALPPDHPATDPFHVDLTSTRKWRGPQIWTETAPVSRQPSPAPRSRSHRERTNSPGKSSQREEVSSPLGNK